MSSTSTTTGPSTSPSPITPKIRLVLVRTQGPVNLGMACRLAANLNIAEFHLVDPICELDCKEARMFANKAQQTLVDMPVFPCLSEALRDCDLVIGTSARNRDADRGETYGLSEVSTLMERWPAQRIAVVFGNEADGLNNEELALCNALVCLDTYSDYYSYNLSHAIAITLYGIQQQLQTRGPNVDEALASNEQRDELSQFWLGMLDNIGYLADHKREWRIKHFSRMFQRMPLNKKDCDFLRGMLAHLEKGQR